MRGHAIIWYPPTETAVKLINTDNMWQQFDWWQIIGAPTLLPLMFLLTIFLGFLWQMLGFEGNCCGTMDYCSATVPKHGQAVLDRTSLVTLAISPDTWPTATCEISVNKSRSLLASASGMILWLESLKALENYWGTPDYLNWASTHLVQASIGPRQPPLAMFLAFHVVALRRNRTVECGTVFQPCGGISFLLLLTFQFSLEPAAVKVASIYSILQYKPNLDVATALSQWVFECSHKWVQDHLVLHVFVTLPWPFPVSAAGVSLHFAWSALWRPIKPNQENNCVSCKRVGAAAVLKLQLWQWH